MLVVLVSNLYPHVYILSIVDVTSCLIVSISVFRWCKCFASQINMFYVFFCLSEYSTFTINWLLHDVPLMIWPIISHHSMLKLMIWPIISHHSMLKLMIWPIISHHSMLKQARNWIYRVYLSIKYSCRDIIQRLKENTNFTCLYIHIRRTQERTSWISCFCCEFSIILSATKA